MRRKARIGIIGAGWWAVENHLPALKAIPDCEIVAVNRIGSGELAEIIADRLGLTGALGTVAETVDGKYTGLLVGDVLHGEAKAHAVQELAAREGLDLAQCSAYSDSINDIPMLSLVGTAVAVNPDSALRAEARDRGWEIRDFRAGRKAIRIGVPIALGASAVAGGVAAGVMIRRRQQLHDERRRIADHPMTSRLAVNAKRIGAA